MLRLRFYLRHSLALISATVLAACAQHGAMVPSTSLAPPLAGALLNLIMPDLIPPKCKGQKTTKNFASLSVKLSTGGGSFCIPAFGGFGGAIKYPPANPSVTLKLIDSTKNYNHQPELGNGKAIFYLQLALGGGTTFGSNVKAGGGLTSKAIVAGKPYTAFGQATVSGFHLDFGPCYAVAIKGKYGGVIGGVGALLKGQSVPVAAHAIIEIYSGKQTGTKC